LGLYVAYISGVDVKFDQAEKILCSHLSENSEARQRLEREDRAISSLSDPNICTLHDVGSQGGTDFPVMDCLEGETLADRLYRGQIASD
jgi:serine/threonine protein kinase